MVKPKLLIERVSQIGQWCLLVGIVLAPIVIYISTFGLHITSDHTRWGEMGSAMSGIYTPILSIFTLLVLVIQVRLQNQSVTHERDQSYVQEARSDIEYYLAQIDLELDKALKKDATVRKFLSEGFSYANIDSLKSKELLKIGQEFNRQFPRSSAIWSAYYSILAGLGSQQHFPYKHNFEAAKQKAISMLSYEICVALDNYIWCLSEGRLNFLYQFSSEQLV